MISFTNFLSKLSSYGTNGYLHMLIGIVVALLVAWIFSVTTVGSVLSFAFSGLVGSIVAGAIKEMVWFLRGKGFNKNNIIFGTIGGLIGAVLFTFIGLI